MAFGLIDWDALYQDHLQVLEAFEVQWYCPWRPPTRWERITDDVLTFIGWR